ncbi:unnamed protein product [Clonostachys rhizophaga]|uniref:FAD-binding PCMH-type domain-containing protein n=1 Tax=Clonostachys rhizophaga TaxID=160324 RepID=A0A9N9VCH1_9HYPO|nr:unnamed protein product [Clonostachys rhizophaga]
MHCRFLCYLATAQWALGLQAGAESTKTPDCKAFPGKATWPARQQWDRLNATISGRLIKPLAPAGVCHAEQPNFSKDACEALGQDWTGYNFHLDDPVSMMFANWANSTCTPDTSKPCTKAGYPAYVVNAESAEDVKAGIDFAREKNVRLVVKSTGHDFLGRSIAPGSLSIWTRHLRSITFHKGEYKLSGSDTVIQGDAVTAGAGVGMYELYQAMDKYGKVVVGGGAQTVSLGGYLTGGGHSPLGLHYGLGADNVLEMVVVTPAGEILTVNEEQSPDLFWALRGGGGSTFGVVISYTIRAYPTPQVQHTLVFTIIPSNSSRRNEFMGFMMGKVPELMDSGLSGLCIVDPDGKTSDVYNLPANMSMFAGSLTLLDRGPDDYITLLDQLNSTLQERFGGEASLVAEKPKSYGTFLEWFSLQTNLQPGRTFLIESWLLDRDTLTNNPDALVEAVTSAAKPARTIYFYNFAGKGVQAAKPRGGSTAIHPGWRKAYTLAISDVEFDPYSETSEMEIAHSMIEAYKPLRELAPGMGSYHNEGMIYDKSPDETFWGDNYERLLEIKRSIDPDDVFWCTPCVGNDRWEQKENGMLCKL